MHAVNTERLNAVGNAFIDFLTTEHDHFVCFGVDDVGRRPTANHAVAVRLEEACLSWPGQPDPGRCFAVV